jgi:hypothetical protein
VNEYELCLLSPPSASMACSGTALLLHGSTTKKIALNFVFYLNTLSQQQTGKQKKYENTE